ncbi:hydrogenase expression protein HupH [Thiocapsa imhoffii]|uniref:Hydrogenase expression protein HupH n=1 Tax=Thiocapsa imhoffii TaxID=382777 RepID=A0A9X0WL74_9GAMM|nr:hydrogenase expression/formation C-terminal domain-containing protein [Thiocapsa imhoffii]MBK1646525.1 hydrogenase expression protein HupH [Thiocapsa imhoffii]
MSLLDEIPVVATHTNRQPASHQTRSDISATTPHNGNLAAILHEVRHALAHLVATGTSTKIDLRTLPFGPGELDQLLEHLGTGEAQARIDAMGPTRIQETAIAGVWLVDYLNPEDQRLAFHLEIATIPEILCPRPQDLTDAIDMLDARLSAGDDTPPLTS